MRSITKAQAKRFILRKQGLLGEYRFVGAEGVLEFVKQAVCIQQDPVDVYGKSHELTLLSRVKDFSSKMLYDLLYRERRLIDYFDKNMSITLAENWPYYKRTRAAYADSLQRSHRIVEENAQKVRMHLSSHGPSFSKDIDSPGKTDWFWSRTSISRAVMESLYFQGELCIHHKQGSKRCFDYSRNCLPDDFLSAPDPNPTDEQYREWLLGRRIEAVGMMWNRSSTAWLCIPDFQSYNRNAAFRSLISQGIIEPVCIDGLRDNCYLLSKDIPLLDTCLIDCYAPRTEIIGPLDNLLWDRKLISALFDFDYTWEIYTPKEKRRYGYYVVPVLQGEDFIGRIKITRDRKRSLLSVDHYWEEEGKCTDFKSLTRSLERLAVYQSLSNVTHNQDLR